MDVKTYNLDNKSVLYHIAEDIPQNENVELLIKHMKQIMTESKTKATGLAAPQIGVSKRLIMIDTKTLKIVLINPFITRRRAGQGLSRESCLSFPGLILNMKRDKQITVEGFSPYWRKEKFNLLGFDAYVVQHEIDHLNGITIK